MFVQLLAIGLIVTASFGWAGSRDSRWNVMFAIIGTIGALLAGYIFIAVGMGISAADRGEGEPIGGFVVGAFFGSAAICAVGHLARFVINVVKNRSVPA